MDGLTNNSPTAKPAQGGQQQQFTVLLGKAREIMGANGEAWLTAIKADPVQAAVTLGVQTVREMAGMSEKAGQPVDPVVLIHVGLQFIKDVAAVANACGAVPDAGLEAYLKDVTSQSMGEYLKLDAQDGLLSPKDKQAAQGMLSQMQAGGEPAGEAPGPDNMPAHENAEAPPVEAAEGAEEDSASGANDPEMAAQLAALRQKRGIAP